MNFLVEFVSWTNFSSDHQQNWPKNHEKTFLTDAHAPTHPVHHASYKYIIKMHHLPPRPTIIFSVKSVARRDNSVSEKSAWYQTKPQLRLHSEWQVVPWEELGTVRQILTKSRPQPGSWNHAKFCGTSLLNPPK